MTIKEEIQNINKQTDQIKEIKLELEEQNKYEQLKARKNTFDKLYEAIEELKSYKECTSIGEQVETILQPIWELSYDVDFKVDCMELEQ